MTEIDRNIELLEGGELFTEVERRIFELVRETCSTFSPAVIARVAGGWVRDKLLGKSCDDIDIAVENANAFSFAERLKAKSAGEVTKVLLLEANPDQAKHLETARVCVFSNIWIDICGLRPNDVSMMSTGWTGTPSDDAHRRDFRMNAIFFNVNTSLIEDFTGGIEDLRSGILRTPLDPRVTFADDPLRILRAFRFAARTELKLDDALIPAARSLVADFGAKITRERITTEFVKSMDGGHPEHVMRNICDAGLLNCVFDPDLQLSLNESEVQGVQ
jgi:tRNA nucleotidyltransferase (CCA-adding enzyme)